MLRLLESMVRTMLCDTVKEEDVHIRCPAATQTEKVHKCLFEMERH